MITINPVKLTRIKPVTFGNKDNNSTRTGLMTLDKNYDHKINFEKDLYITRNADPVQSNPIKAIAYSFVKAYNILSTPKRNHNGKEVNYIHTPYWA